MPLTCGLDRNFHREVDHFRYVLPGLFRRGRRRRAGDGARAGHVRVGWRRRGREAAGCGAAGPAPRGVAGSGGGGVRGGPGYGVAVDKALAGGGVAALVPSRRGPKGASKLTAQLAARTAELDAGARRCGRSPAQVSAWPPGDARKA
jgi:hypothetical protein